MKTKSIPDRVRAWLSAFAQWKNRRLQLCALFWVSTCCDNEKENYFIQDNVFLFLFVFVIDVNLKLDL